ncbi:MAG: TolC family protein [Sulfuricurvum sp.]
MKYILLILSACLSLSAEVVDIATIKASLSKHSLAKKADELRLANVRSSEALIALEPLELELGAGGARSDEGERSFEWSAGVEQKFLTPNATRVSKNAQDQLNRSQELRDEHTLLQMQNEAILSYHNICLDRNSLDLFSTDVSYFSEIVTQKKREFELGEIAKKEFVELSLELKRIEMAYERFRSSVDLDRQKLLLSLDLSGDLPLACSDLYTISAKPELGGEYEDLLERSLEFEALSHKSEAELFGSSVSDYSLGLSFDDEIDMKRAKLYLSIPLGVTSSKKEHQKAEALHKKSASIYEKEAYLKSKSITQATLKKRLELDYENISSTARLVEQYKNELLAISKRAYELGEIATHEYMLAQRDYLDQKMRLVEAKKEYYKTLFELLAVLQIRGSL